MTNMGVGRRLIFVSNSSINDENKYVAGSNIGSYNISVRRALKKRATSKRGYLNKKNMLLYNCKCQKRLYINGGSCRPAELDYNPSNLAFPHSYTRMNMCFCIKNEAELEPETETELYPPDGEYPSYFASI